MESLITFIEGAEFRTRSISPSGQPACAAPAPPPRRPGPEVWAATLASPLMEGPEEKSEMPKNQAALQTGRRVGFREWRGGRRKEKEGDEGVRREGQETRKEGESRRAERHMLGRG